MMLSRTVGGFLHSNDREQITNNKPSVVCSKVARLKLAPGDTLQLQVTVLIDKIAAL